MKSKFWRRRRMVSSPRVTIRTPWSWSTRVGFMLAVVATSAAAGIWLFENSRAFAGVSVEDARQQLISYRDQVTRLSAERDQLSASANSAESELNIERAAQRQLLAQVKALEAENARLKEDLAFFDSLLPNASAPQGIAIRRLKIDQVAPNQLSYRVLVMQGGRGDHFSGVLQLVITTVQDGKTAMMVFPEETSAEPGRFKLGFRHYQRLEGVLALPEGTTATMVSARVLDKGQIRAQTSVNL
ncbi:MAG TPA: DUF6776 family protein [Noviherbaspirillum sp.]|nr:DUF6776 family protein [Noviherbaspirillum sp.]